MDTPTQTADVKREIVNRGVDVFERAEATLDKAFVAIGRLDKILRDGNAAGMVGSLATMEMTAEVASMAGAVMDIKRRIARLHRDCTAIAIEHGVDVPVPRSGGGGR